MPYGYTGKILRVDLTAGRITIETQSEAFYRKYLGGSALNLYYLLKEMPVSVDPLGPENMLGLSVGVTTGTPISGNSRMTATAKSPLTGAIGDAQVGGFWPAELKKAGFDGVILKGRAQSPVYLWINNGKAELKDASKLWGKVTGEAEALIKTELDDPKVQILQVGPAGEKGVHFASLIHMCNRAAGRTGMGAVMGSKNLKAVVVRGNQKPEIANKEVFKNLVRWGTNAYSTSGFESFGKYGTAAVVGGQQQVGGLPTYNYSSGVFNGWKKIDGSTLYDTLLRGCEEGKQDTLGRDTCFACIVRCKRVVEKKSGPYKLDPVYGGPEYESLSTLGSYCGVDDLPAVCKANEYCNAYGLDTISCGATIAWAMETFKSGQLTLEETGGLELKFGNAEAMVEMVKQICENRGFGKVLAQGSQAAAKTLGKGSEFLVTAKGQEAPAHMPQKKVNLALIYAVNPFGADHESSGHDPDYDYHYDGNKERFGSLGIAPPQDPPGTLNPGKVAFSRITQDLFSVTDSLCLCQFVWGPSWQLLGPQHLLDLLNSVTGWEMTMEELLAVGARRVNMMQAFNAREGVLKKRETLADKFFTMPLKGGPTDGFCLDREEVDHSITEYYRQRGWDPDTGYPLLKALEKLGVGWVADSS